MVGWDAGIEIIRLLGRRNATQDKADGSTAGIYGVECGAGVDHHPSLWLRMLPPLLGKKGNVSSPVFHCFLEFWIFILAFSFGSKPYTSHGKIHAQ